MPKPKLPKKDFDWTPELAYAVGLIVTDGSLSSDGRHIVMRSSEKEQLNNFKKCLHIGHCKIGTSKPNSGSYSNKISYRVQYGNVQLYNWLRKIGIPRNKTYDIGALDVPDFTFPDFLRGHLDGDGSITTYIDRYNTYKNPKYIYERIWVRFISANKQHLEWLQEMCSEVLGVRGHLNKRSPKRPKRVPMYSLKFGKKESKRLLKQIYYKKDLPCLSRKRKVAEKFI